MDNKELYKIECRAKRARELKISMNEIDNVMSKLNPNGKIEEIRIGYWGKSSGGFGAEAGEDAELTMAVNYSTLKIKKIEFSDALSNAIYNSLLSLKGKLKQEYEDL